MGRANQYTKVDFRKVCINAFSQK